MVLMSSFSLKCDNKNLDIIFSIVKEVVKGKGDWGSLVKTMDDMIVVEEDHSLKLNDYKDALKQISDAILRKEDKINYVLLGEFYDDNNEIHESIIVQNGCYQRYLQQEDYNEGTNEHKYFFSLVHNKKVDEVLYESDSLDLDDVMCKSCGEYIVKHYEFPFAYCPYCHHVEVDEEAVVETVAAKWEEYKFEIPLGIDLPKDIVSQGADWHSDCEEDNVFGLSPACYESLNQYNAALRLCKTCAGWFYYESDNDKQKYIDCYRDVIKAKVGQPMWYYDVYQNTFRWIDALRECHPNYKGKLLNVESIWDLFYKLQQRSIIEKADVFEWLVDFFGECLKYEGRYKLSDNYLQNYYDNHIETILYLREHQIDILTKSSAKVSTNSITALARASAGLIRMGKKELGLSLYKRMFAFAWGVDTSVEDKKNVMDSFIERLSMGYENEQYIDDDIAALLDRQCAKYSDGAWSSKIRMSLGRK